MGLFNVLGSLQNIESAEAAGDPYDTRLADGQRRRQPRRGAVRLCVSDDDLHRPSGMEGARRARRLLGAERRVRHAHLPDRHARVDRLGDPDRRRHGDRALDRHRDHRAGVSGDAARACAGGRRRPAAGHRRLGRADGEERPARRRTRGAAGAVQRSAHRRVPEERHVDPRRLRARAGIPLHVDDPLGRRRRRHRAAMERCRRLVRVGRAALGHSA